MAEPVEELERRIERLRSAVRHAVTTGDRATARTLRAELRRAEDAWEEALDDLADQAPAAPLPPRQRAVPGLLPLREQVHTALSLLSVPAAPRLVVQVHHAFFGEDVPSAKLTSLRRDEERSFRSAPFARPYYLCAALTADRLAPARGLLAVSTWPLEHRIVGPLSPRVDFLTAAVRVAEHAERLSKVDGGVARLLWMFGANIPGAASGIGTAAPAAVIRAARAELDSHTGVDRSHRTAAAARARAHLDDVGQLFGTQLRAVRSRTGT
ncbi:hypothetical protein Val02_86450 [Virgisporangium aliadipatigenens]|uniref:Uncharacterized protein n=1 Tax=Virgisporangium aliadipatigenens TaxID=741659 RepID=A0A8J4DVF9_9ACTN|nr:hypothetical protein [Virgisporangium aliadipatigenens]GIJ51759.1 hypothetical protein Val02_86450 [Virgisporangium aliadipatigenens]